MAFSLTMMLHHQQERQRRRVNQKGLKGRKMPERSSDVGHAPKRVPPHQDSQQWMKVTMRMNKVILRANKITMRMNKVTMRDKEGNYEDE